MSRRIIGLLLLGSLSIAAAPSRKNDRPVREAVRLARELKTNETEILSVARDLETWSGKYGHPMTAEAMIGSILLRANPAHKTTYPATDTSLPAQYQRLEMRVTSAFATRERLSRDARALSPRLHGWLRANAKSLGKSKATHRFPILPPEATSSGRLALLGFDIDAWLKCGFLTYENGTLCITEEAYCTPEPDATEEFPFWVTTCVQECFQIGNVLVSENGPNPGTAPVPGNPEPVVAEVRRAR